MSILKGKLAASTFHVFISHSMKDMQMVRKIAEALKGAGAMVFVADSSISPGDSLRASISAAISGCNLFVVLWSKHSAASDWVRQEVGQATGLKKRIVIFVLDAEANVPTFLEDLKCIRGYEDLDANITSLTKQVESLFAAKRQDIADREAQAWAVLIASVLVLMVLQSKK